MSHFLKIQGADAITVSVASNRQCEVLQPTGGWRTAPSQQAAMRAFRIQPQTIRLCGDARVILEDVLHMSLPVDSDLLNAIRSTDSSNLPEQEVKALAIIEGLIS